MKQSPAGPALRSRLIVNVQQVNGAIVGGDSLIQWSSKHQAFGKDVDFTSVPGGNAHAHLQWNGALQCVEQGCGHDL